MPFEEGRSLTGDMLRTRLRALGFGLGIEVLKAARSGATLKQIMGELPPPDDPLEDREWSLRHKIRYLKEAELLQETGEMPETREKVYITDLAHLREAMSALMALCLELEGARATQKEG